MENPDNSKMISCPKCGAIGAIYVLKVTGKQLLIKQRCPRHGGRAFKIPLMQRNLILPHIPRALYRCYKCGQDATVDHIRVSGPWTLIRCACPTHGNKLPYQKIWSSIYAELSNMASNGPPPPQPIQQQAQPQPQPINKFCPQCGTILEGSEKFCGMCGEEID